jgi:CBS domain-containing protein
MSFLVVYNGQFSPFVYPTGTPSGVPRVTPLENLKDVHEFKDELSKFEPEVKSNHNHQKIDAYKQVSKKFEEQRKRYYAKDIMTIPVKVISQNAMVTEAHNLFKKFGFRHLPVINEQEVIVGMLSDRELTAASPDKRCKDLMLERIIVAEEQASINEIAIILLKEKLNALPIINQKREVTGIITLSDILKYVIESTSFLGRG